MPNVLDQTPLILDSTGNNLVTGKIWIAKIRWVGASAAGHTAVIKDGNSKIIWASIAPGTANNLEIDTFPSTAFLKCDGSSTTGLSVTTLASGILYIYLA